MAEEATTLEAEPVAADATEAPPEAPETTPETPEGQESPTTSGEAPAVVPGSPPDLAEPPETLRVTWEDGTESDVPVADLVQGYQLAVRAKDDIRQAQEVQGAAEEMLRGLVQNPMGTIHDALSGLLGGDREKALEELGRITTEFSDAWKQMKGLPPAEQELMKLRREHAALRARLEKQETKAQADEEATQVAESTRKALTDINGALKAAGLPERPVLVKAVARELLDAHQSKEKLTTAQAVVRVKKQLQTELEERLKAVGDDPKAFEGLYPKVTELVRKRDLNGVKTAQSARVKGSPSRTPEPANKPRVLRNDNWNEIFGG